MRYFILSVILLASCSGGLKIQDVDHPIDTIKQQKLVENDSAVVKIDLFKLSMLSLIVTTLIVGGWWFVSIKQTKKEKAPDQQD